MFQFNPGLLWFSIELRRFNPGLLWFKSCLNCQQTIHKSSRRSCGTSSTRLKALNDAQAAQITALTARVQALESGKASMDDVNAAIVANSSANCDSVEQLDLQPSDPPTQNDVYQTVYRVNVLIGTLHRQG